MRVIPQKVVATLCNTWIKLERKKDVAWCDVHGRILQSHAAELEKATSEGSGVVIPVTIPRNDPHVPRTTSCCVAARWRRAMGRPNFRGR
jgi:hypothetical protein